MQIVLVILAIIIALAYLVRKFYSRFFKKEPDCDGCSIGKSNSK